MTVATAFFLFLSLDALFAASCTPISGSSLGDNEITRTYSIFDPVSFSRLHHIHIINLLKTEESFNIVQSIWHGDFLPLELIQPDGLRSNSLSLTAISS